MNFERKSGILLIREIGRFAKWKKLVTPLSESRLFYSYLTHPPCKQGYFPLSKARLSESKPKLAWVMPSVVHSTELKGKSTEPFYFCRF